MFKTIISRFTIAASSIERSLKTKKVTGKKFIVFDSFSVLL